MGWATKVQVGLGWVGRGWAVGCANGQGMQDGCKWGLSFRGRAMFRRKEVGCRTMGGGVLGCRSDSRLWVMGE